MDGLEQENIRLKEKLFKSENQIELMEHKIQSLRLRNNELKNLLTRVDADIRFLDHQALSMFIFCLHVILYAKTDN
jgi:dynactin complex subunit